MPMATQKSHLRSCVRDRDDIDATRYRDRGDAKPALEGEMTRAGCSRTATGVILIVASGTLHGTKYVG